MSAGAARCQRCGAPLELTPETIVAVCPYCGFPNWTAQAYVYPIELVPAVREKARTFFQNYLRTDPDMRGLASQVTLKSLETIYIPYYYADVEASTRYFGVAKVSLHRVRVERHNGKTTVRTETRVVDVDVRGTFSSLYTIPIVARRNVDKSFSEPLGRYYLESRPQTKPIAEVDWESVKGTVLASEIPSSDAEVMARDEACEKLYDDVTRKMEEEAKSKAMAMNPGWVVSGVSWTVKKIPCRAVNKTLSPLLLLPAVVAVYSYRGGLFKAVFAGWDGARLYAEEPLTAAQRGLYFAGQVLAGGLLGGGGAALAAAGGDYAVAGALMVIGGMIGSYLLGRSVIKDVRVERR